MLCLNCQLVNINMLVIKLQYHTSKSSVVLKNSV